MRFSPSRERARFVFRLVSRVRRFASPSPILVPGLKPRISRRSSTPDSLPREWELEPVWDYRSPLALLRIIAEPSPFRVKSARAQLLWCLYPCTAPPNQLKPPPPSASTPQLPSLPDFNGRACHLLGSHQVVGHGENNCALPLNPEKASRNEA